MRLFVAAAGKPRLQQGAIAGKGKERQADGSAEQANEPESRAGLRRLAKAGGAGDGQAEQGGGQHGHVDQCGPAHRQITREHVGIKITGQQHGLKKHHGDRPDTG